MFRRVTDTSAKHDVAVMGQIVVAPADVVKRFGQPTWTEERGEYVFVDDRNELFVLHDPRAYPGAEQFWASRKPIELAISSSAVDISDFAEWLDGQFHGDAITETAISADVPLTPPIETPALAGGVVAPELPSDDTCGECGCRIPAGEAVLRSNTKTEMAGAVARHESVHRMLCPACAESYDATGNRLMWGMAFFVVVVVGIALASCVFR